MTVFLLLFVAGVLLFVMYHYRLPPFFERLDETLPPIPSAAQLIGEWDTLSMSEGDPAFHYYAPVDGIYEVNGRVVKAKKGERLY